MLGAIAGDIIGSIYEHRPIKTAKFPLFHPLCRFTDDTVLTVALADSIFHGTGFVGLVCRNASILRRLAKKEASRPIEERLAW